MVKSILSKLSPTDILFGVIASWPQEYVCTERLYGAMRKTVLNQGLMSGRRFYPTSESFEMALDFAMIGQVLSDPLGEPYSMISGGMRRITLQSIRKAYSDEVIPKLRKLSSDVRAAMSPAKV